MSVRLEMLRHAEKSITRLRTVKNAIFKHDRAIAAAHHLTFSAHKSYTWLLVSGRHAHPPGSGDHIPHWTVRAIGKNDVGFATAHIYDNGSVKSWPTARAKAYNRANIVQYPI